MCRLYQALQEEKSRTSHELSSVRKQLHTLRLSAPTGGDTPCSGPASLPNNGSIHDEIINTVSTRERGTFLLRLERFWPDMIIAGLWDCRLDEGYKAFIIWFKSLEVGQPRRSLPGADPINWTIHRV